MSQERLNLLEKYIQLGISPLLIEDMPMDLFQNKVVIKSTIQNLELNGHYENIDFCPPIWYQELLEKSKQDCVVLVIENINKIDLMEQLKFIEVLKYRKISTFPIPKNCIIIATCTDLNHNKIHQDVLSLLAQI